MLFLIVTIVTWSSSSAFPGYQHSGHKLQTVPYEAEYGKIKYPHFDIIDLGEYRKNGLPPKLVHINKKIVIKEPKPYPVKIPHPVPYPVVQEIPYPVVKQEVVKVPEPVPYPVLNTVHVPVEVPKPYPVSGQEYEGSSSTGYGGDTPELNQVDFDQNNGNSFAQEGHYDQGPWKPSGLDQYRKLNEYIQTNREQQNSEERPVYEDHQEGYAS